MKNIKRQKKNRSPTNHVRLAMAENGLEIEVNSKGDLSMPELRAEVMKFLQNLNINKKNLIKQAKTIKLKEKSDYFG